MDEKLVSTYSSVKRGGADLERPSSLFAYLWPQYLAYGMTREEFWKGEPCLAKEYLAAHKFKQEERNTEMWLQGAYIQSAIASCLSKDVKYPDEPFPLSKEEKEERDEREAFDRMQRYMSQFMATNNKEKEDSNE